MRLSLAASFSLFAMSLLRAQQPLGTVALEDATVTGNLSVTAGRAVLVGSGSVTAKDHTAEIALARGGTVRVCATSGLHLSLAQGAGAQPLLLALDRGAFELHSTALANDVILTPDLRFSVRAGGPLDLRLRVTSNGDTCVENSGASAPMLSIADQFGDSTYLLRAGQHVLFEHGSLKEVVDHESSPCGCPPATPAPGVSVAEALLAPGTPGKSAAEQHPFPAAVSQGLAPAPAVPQAATGETHAQVSTTLGFAGDGSGVVHGAPAATPPAPAPVVSPAPPPAPKKRGFGHGLGHFFKRLFGGRSLRLARDQKRSTLQLKG